MSVKRKDIHVVVLGGSDSLSGEASASLSGQAEDPNHRLVLRGNNDSSVLISDELSWAMCYIGPNYYRRPGRWDLSRCSVIVNLISDPDKNPKTLRVAERFTAKHRDRLINDPRLIARTKRDDVARVLEGTPWLHVPKVIRLRNPTAALLGRRMEATGFTFPAIVRQAGTHSGGVVGVFQKPEELMELFSGLKGDHYFTEFVDCRQSDGLYRKMRFYSVGGEIFLAHAFASEHWNIHAETARDGIMKDREDLRDEERHYFAGEPAALMTRAQEMMTEVTRRLKLDYFGLDCGPTDDGRFVLFEANATMQIKASYDDPVFRYSQTNGVRRGIEPFNRLLLKRAVPLRLG